eukprot:TRINITY_DN1295_c0_g1_i1.p1 TRINITY_DN1295_c0_g1~~TRINITY_DN1295_c0_g1_i1.p1  ORF type:complete len:297 (-),score=57.01 TRINITY_DN1295_c0_g1_i1:99-989(-)
MTKNIMKKVLSIQSHVVSGYVGNRVSVFALQLLGYDVDFINTVQFSNHTGYPSFRGQVLSPDQLNELYEGLKQNNLNQYDCLVTGFMGNATILQAIMNIVDDQKKMNPSFKYFCDPVMGDGGSLYSSMGEEMITKYNNLVLTNADYLFPNQTECEYLTNMKIIDIPSALEAIDILHNKGISCVVITSIEFPGDNSIILIASQIQDDGELERIKVVLPKINQDFTGTGDLFTSTFLGWSMQQLSLIETLSNTLVTVQTIINSSIISKDNPNGELRLVQHVMDIMHPPQNPGFEIQRL